VKRVPDLPNIEDATLRACLAPLMEAMITGTDSAPAGYLPPTLESSDLDTLPGPANCNDLPFAPVDGVAVDLPCVLPRSRDAWRAEADEDAALFRTIAVFLNLSEAELDHAARDFPRQIGGTLARIGDLRARLMARYDRAATAAAMLRRALARADRGDGEAGLGAE